jgi:hypothetical protein
MYNQIDLFVTTGFTLLILLYCLNAFLLRNGIEDDETQSSSIVGDRP